MLLGKRCRLSCSHLAMHQPCLRKTGDRKKRVVKCSVYSSNQENVRLTLTLHTSLLDISWEQVRVQSPLDDEKLLMSALYRLVVLLQLCCMVLVQPSMKVV